MTTAVPYMPPISRGERVRDRLSLMPASIDWNRAEEIVQDALTRLSAAVFGRRPAVRSRPHANRTERFPLFAYRTFIPVPTEGFDPIVVGVTFKRTAQGILVRGDMVGEETGTVHFEHPECRLEVREQSEAVLRAARQVAARLEVEVDRLVDALDAPEPVVP
jgi:hypothetical protein